MALQGKDKQIIELANELAKKLKEGNFKSAYKVAGDLHYLLKGEGDLTLSEEVVQEIRKDLKSYYSMNYEYNKLSKRAFAIGCSFERSASI
ncbi:hypothetical protein ACVRXA_08095 [Streptococcus pseudopneumoniae]|uniref:hypothetical protein n=1 Tax=Streptococcus pseudopneumoniae TaxID=257758 RepID=UPI001C6581E5|nr:hypothetical protein [Streptococcus pseudopneumoniae]MBW8142311.1 hypothetical protein [Streptococcus pseudopneumoniae]